MQFGGLCLVVVFLSWADLTGSESSSHSHSHSHPTAASKGKRQRRISTEMAQGGCAKGCDLCSEFNGCLKCSPKLFILLERNAIREIGICLPSCPLGYFDVRTPDMNKCLKCKIDNCEDCFSRNFCTKCKDTLYLHKGRCHETCPQGFSAVNGTLECSGPAPCEMGEWSPWGPCSKRKKRCGFRRGNEERSRRILQVTSGDVSTCPATSELRRCTMQRNPCPQGWKKKKVEQGHTDKEDRSHKDVKKSRPGVKRRKGQPWGTYLTTAAAATVV